MKKPLISARALPFVISALFAAGSQGQTTGAPVERPDPEGWNSFRGDALNQASRVFDVPGVSEPDEWTFKPASWTWAYRPGTGVWSSPSIGNIGESIGLFVGSYDNNLYAIDAFTGRELWRYTTGGEIYSTPAVAYVNGLPRLFFGSAERVLYALDASDGGKVWAYQIIDWRYTVGEAYIPSPATYTLDGRQVVVFCWWVHDASFTQPLETTEALLLDCTDGGRLWQKPFSKSPPSSPCVGTIDGDPRVFVSARDGNTYCLDGKTGEVLWTHTGRGEIVSSPACATQLDLPLVFVGSRYGDFHALDARTGFPVWVFKAGHWIDSSPALVETGGQWFVVFGSHDQAVYCLNAATGRRRWSFSTKGDVYSSPAVIRDEDATLIAIASGDDYVYLLDAASGREVTRYRPGRFLWEYRVVGDSIWSSPIAARLNGKWMLYAPFYDGKIHAFRIGKPGNVAKSLSSHGKTMLLKMALTALGTVILIGILFRIRRSKSQVADE